MDSLIDLIAIASRMLDSSLDVNSFLEWRTASLIVLVGLLGPFHYYTLNFRRFAKQPGYTGILAGLGLLVAAKEKLCSDTGSGTIR